MSNAWRLISKTARVNEQSAVKKVRGKKKYNKYTIWPLLKNMVGRPAARDWSRTWHEILHDLDGVYHVLNNIRGKWVKHYCVKFGPYAAANLPVSILIWTWITHAGTGCPRSTLGDDELENLQASTSENLDGYGWRYHPVRKSAATMRVLFQARMNKTKKNQGAPKYIPYRNCSYVILFHLCLSRAACGHIGFTSLHFKKPIWNSITICRFPSEHRDPSLYKLCRWLSGGR